MVFSSLFFVFFFLPLCLLFHSILPGIRAKNILLLVFSLVFYAWGGPSFLLILVTDTFLCWIFSLEIAKAQTQPRKKLLLILNCITVLGILVFFKYTGMLVSGWNTISGKLFSAAPLDLPNIVLPIGISFYTFQLISYSVDVYRNAEKVQKNFFQLLLYASLFHQCIAGPIIRYEDVCGELDKRRITIPAVFEGIVRFSVGLAKKAVLANGCALVVDQFLLPDALGHASRLGIMLGVLAYTLQLYLDFSAYSDMAIGMGLMMGFHFPENFNYPYISRSVTEFWRRWHITLSSFFRDYVYIPLGGNRRGAKRMILNMLVVWSLTGLWHGTHLNFILWGLYYFVFLMIDKFLLKKFWERVPSLIRGLITFVIVAFGWMLFYYSDFAALKTALVGLFGANPNGFSSMTTMLVFKNHMFLLIFSCLACVPWYKTLRNYLYRKPALAHRPAQAAVTLDIIVSLLCLILSLLALIGNSYNPFLYFQF